MDRAVLVHANFLRRVGEGDLPPRRTDVSLADSGLSGTDLVDLFRSQVLSRQLDRSSRGMQVRGEGFYTIGSSGHEGNAAVAAAFRPDDMAFLHYRDAAFLIQRSKMIPGQTIAWDMMLSFAASSEDPVSGGRHKVLGSKALSIPPQTSTIASHLPKAVGAAFSIGLARRVKPEDPQLAADGVILCSFGDASFNHSTAQGAINTACWSAYQGAPMPLVLLCEDNGIGISVKTPPGWIEAAAKSRPGLTYMACDGLDLLDTYKTACAAAAHARRTRTPVFLHMRCVRLFGHAGSDTQSVYMARKDIEADEANDPLLHSARLLIDHDILGQEQILEIYQETERTTERIAREVATRPKLSTPAQIMASLEPPRREVQPTNGPSAESRAALFGDDLPVMEKPQHMARLISWALSDLMLEHGHIVVAGEDVGRKGGVYTVTQKLLDRFGPQRVVDTLLDEQSILGLAIGMAHNGFLPIPEIQFLAYLHNAEDQVRGEAATLSFFSNGQFTNPMIIRIAGLGYQRGFGGHFHNDNSIAVLRDIPGLVIACPSNGSDAVMMLRECVRLAREEQKVCVFLEPIALYMTRDLHGEKDGLWACRYPAPGEGVPVRAGEPAVHGDGGDLAIVTFANGTYLSLQAQKILQENHGIQVRIVDLRWLAPIDPEQVIAAVGPCRKVLIVDECRETGSQSEGLMTLFHEWGVGEYGDGLEDLRRVTAHDTFIPLGRAATVPLPSRDEIVAAVVDMCAPDEMEEPASFEEAQS